jgi:hypothetical protein
MNVIEELKRRIDKLPGARYESDTASITVLPHNTDGFNVTLMQNSANGYTVFFNGWHEDFEDPEETVNVFGLGLSDECRLKEYRRGSFAYKWTVETLENGEWLEHSTTALLLFPFWRKREIHYLQNRLLPHTEAISSR